MKLATKHFFLAFVAGLLFSCQMNDNIGAEVLGNEETKGKINNELSVISYNISASNINTGIISHCTIGSSKDPVFGSSKASFSGRILIPEDQFSLSNEVFLDSIIYYDTLTIADSLTYEKISDTAIYNTEVLQLESFGLKLKLNTYYGPTSGTQRFYIVRLEQGIDPSDNTWGSKELVIKDTIGFSEINPDSAIKDLELTIPFYDDVAKRIFTTMTSIRKTKYRIIDTVNQIINSSIQNQEMLDNFIGSIAIISDSNSTSNGMFTIDPYNTASGISINFKEDGISKSQLLKFDNVDIIGHASYTCELSDRINAFGIDTINGSDTIGIKGLYANGLMIKIPEIKSIENQVVQSAELYIPILQLEDDYNPPLSIMTFNDKFEIDGFSSLNFTSTQVVENFNGYEETFYKLNIVEYINKYLLEGIDPEKKGIEIIIDPDIPDRVLLGGNENIKLHLVVRDLN